MLLPSVRAAEKVTKKAFIHSVDPHHAILQPHHFRPPFTFSKRESLVEAKIFCFREALSCISISSWRLFKESILLLYKAFFDLFLSILHPDAFLFSGLLTLSSWNGFTERPLPPSSVAFHLLLFLFFSVKLPCFPNNSPCLIWQYPLISELKVYYFLSFFRNGCTQSKITLF